MRREFMLEFSYCTTGAVYTRRFGLPSTGGYSRVQTGRRSDSELESVLTLLMA